jgi:broad specificity phosphatase PhoE
MMEAIFIRHGQSTGNAGIPCNDLALLELTETGWSQARQVATNWTQIPNLIVTSPYLRTQQTAQPTIDRFLDVSVEVWPIQEFTYLQPSRWNGTRSIERLPYIEAYWRNADPDYCDGEGAESFSALLCRASDTLSRLKNMPDDSLTYIFSHGQFIQATQSLVSSHEMNEQERMRGFWQKGSPAIANAELVRVEWDGHEWRSKPL